MRVLDFGKTDPFEGLIGRPRDVAWPVHAFRVSMPVRRRGINDLDPFEQVIVRMIEIEGLNTEEALADEVCLPGALVRNVLIKLRARGIIDSNNRVVENSERAWKTRSQSGEIVSAWIFKELVGGKLLPHLHDGSLEFRNIPDERYIRKMNLSTPSPKSDIPSPKDVLEVLRIMRRRDRILQQESHLPAIDQIRVLDYPELYFLRCRIGISNRDAKTRLADPFAKRLSLELSESFDVSLMRDESLQKWVDRWRGELVLDPKNVSKREGGSSRRKDRKTDIFRELVEFLELPPDQEFRSLPATFASLEWCLYFVSQLHDPMMTITRMRFFTVGEFEKRILEACDVVGLLHQSGLLHHVKKGKVDDYLQRKPEINTVLTICILQAQLDKNHPLRRLAKRNPKFILDVRELARLRGQEAHGGGISAWADEYQLWSEFLHETVTTLLPSLRFEAGSPIVQLDEISNLKLLARNSMTTRLGHRCLFEIGPTVEETLLKAEMFGQAEARDRNAIGFIINLSAALQAVFEQSCDRNRGIREFLETESELIDAAATRAESFRLYGFGASLRTVSPRKLRKALQGGESSLGALVVTFLLIASDHDLSWLANHDTSILQTCSELISLRGHGNQRMSLTDQEVQSLLERTVRTMSNLIELRTEG